MSFKTYLLKRAIIALVTVIASLSISFIILKLVPGDPLVTVAGGQLTPAQLAALRQAFGLDKPIWQQYLLFVYNFLQGNWGYSIATKRLVIEELATPLLNTLVLAGVAVTAAVFGGLILGVQAAARYGRRSGALIFTGSVLFYSFPAFWIGILILYVFAFELGLFPFGGTLTSPPPAGLAAVPNYLYHMTLPAVVLTLNMLAIFMLITRASVLDELSKDYVLLARAKGVSRTRLLYKHVLRNAILPLMSSIPLNLGWILTGAVLVEITFSWVGLGHEVVVSVFDRDFPVLLGAIFVVTLIIVIGNFIVDVLHGYLDPRIKAGA